MPPLESLSALPASGPEGAPERPRAAPGPEDAPVVAPDTPAPQRSVVDISSPGGADVTSYAVVLVRDSHEGVLEVLMTEEKQGGKLDVPKKRKGGEG